jgi:hypothetical protein
VSEYSKDISPVEMFRMKKQAEAERDRYRDLTRRNAEAEDKAVAKRDELNAEAQSHAERAHRAELELRDMRTERDELLNEKKDIGTAIGVDYFKMEQDADQLKAERDAAREALDLARSGWAHYKDGQTAKGTRLLDAALTRPEETKR